MNYRLIASYVFWILYGYTFTSFLFYSEDWFTNCLLLGVLIFLLVYVEDGDKFVKLKSVKEK